MSGGRFISQIDKNAVKVILATLILIGIDVYFLFTGFSGKSGRFWILLIVNFISIFIINPDTGNVGVEKNGLIEDLNKKQREYYANMMKFQDIDKKKYGKIESTILVKMK